MTDTEVLRRLLDERGIEWWQVGKDVIETVVDGVRHKFRQVGRGIIWSSCTESSVTPEQAIAATLGPGTCKPVAYDNVPYETHVEPGDYYEFWEPACACSACGELIPMRKFCPNCGAKVVEPTTNDVDAEVGE